MNINRIIDAFKISIKVFKNDKTTLHRLVNLIQSVGLLGLFHLIKRKLFQLDNITDSKEINIDIDILPNYCPLISIVMPTYNTPIVWLEKSIQSIFNQSYKNWELCICDDFSKNIETINLLRSLQGNQKIKIVYNSSNLGISLATNRAINISAGEYVAFMDHDDELNPNALFFVVTALQQEKYDLLYTNEDKIDELGNRFSFFYKPSWSPERLMSTNYISHFSVVSRMIGDQVGWLRAGFEGSQDYDFILRVTGETQKIKHLPQILYHWRALPSSTALSSGIKSSAHLSGKKALQDFIKKKDLPFIIDDNIIPGHFKLTPKLEKSKQVTLFILDEGEIKYKREFDLLKYYFFEIKQITGTLTIREKISLIKQSETELIMFLKGDSIPYSTFKGDHWVKQWLAPTFIKEVGIVGISAVDRRGRIKYGPTFLTSKNSKIEPFSKMYSRDIGQFGNLIDWHNCEWVNEENILINKACFLNESEEIRDTLCDTVTSYGYRVVWNPRVSVKYKHGLEV